MRWDNSQLETSTSRELDQVAPGVIFRAIPTVRLSTPGFEHHESSNVLECLIEYESQKKKKKEEKEKREKKKRGKKSKVENSRY